MATAAGLATLSLLTPEAYATLAGRVERFSAALEDVLRAAGIAVRVPHLGTLCGLFAGDELPTDYDGARTTDEALYASLFHAMLDRGVAMAPGAYEVAFVGLAHTDEVLDRIIEVAVDAAAAVQEGTH